MPDDDDTLDTTEEPESSVINRLRRELRESKRMNSEAAEALKAGTAAQRELAMLKAGINPQAPGAEWFIKGYDGELDPAKIREAGAAFVGQPQPQQPQQFVQPPPGQGQPWQDPYFAAAQEQYAQQAGWTQAQGVTAGPQQPPGVNHIEGMRQAGEKDGAAGIARYLAQHGLPVVDSWNAQGGYPVQ